MQWVIGDIHGCALTLQKLLSQVFAKDSSPNFVFLGDYVDRGLYSKQVIGILTDLDKDYPCVFLLGNHDDMFVHERRTIYNELDFPESVIKIPRGKENSETHRSIGPVAHKEVIEFFHKLKLHHRDGELYYAHAWFGNTPMNYLWSRPPHEWSKHIVPWCKFFKCTGAFFGHTPAKDNLAGINRVFHARGTCSHERQEYNITMMDTMGQVDAESGLSAYCWEDNTAIFVKLDQRDITESN